MVNKEDISGSTTTVPSEPPPPSVIDDSSEAITQTDQDGPASIEAATAPISEASGNSAPARWSHLSATQWGS